MTYSKEDVENLLHEHFPNAELIDYSPLCLGSVSMVPLATLGVLFVFRDQDGKERAIPVPFGLTFASATEAA